MSSLRPQSSLRTPSVSKQQAPFGKSGNGSEGSSAAVSTSNGNPEQDAQGAPGRLLAKGSDRSSLGEKFNVDTRTGGVSFRVPIHTSPGRSGFGPSLDLFYDSGSAGANGIFGLGWRLAGVDSITRKTSVMIPTYDENHDSFVHSSVGDLVPVLQKDSSDPTEREAKFKDAEYRVRLYRPRIESDPIRIERWSRPDGRMHWKTVSSENVTTIFGPDESSRVCHPADGQRGGRELCFSWLESDTYDSHGNHMVLSYLSDTADDLAQAVTDKAYEAHRNATARATQRYLKSIKYGNKAPNRDLKTWQVLPGQNDRDHWMFEVALDYRGHTTEPSSIPAEGDWDVRPDPFSVYSSGFEIRTYRRCQRVLMYHHFPDKLGRQDCLVAATEFQYRTDPKSGASMLQSSTPCGYSLTDDGTYSCLRLASTTFEYTAGRDLRSAPVEELDLGLSGLSTPAAQWVDLNGDGAPGVLAQVPGCGWYYHPNNSTDEPAIRGPTLVSRIPSAVHSDRWGFEDLTGDGQLDVACVSADGLLRGFYKRVEGGEWSNFIPFELYPADYSAADPTIVKIDLNGNGHADLLRLAARGDNESTWYPSLGRRGYGPEKRTTGAPVVPTGNARLLSLCDMTGDGLSDIVIVYNSHVYYRPNMGHGRFGPKVVMGNPPFLGDSTIFSPLRIRMADVTGTGTADLIYLPPDGGVRVYYNCSGDYWSAASDSPAFPPLDRFCAVDVFDIGGRGTQCLCWTSDHLSHGTSAESTTVRFLDLMGGCKPGLLTRCSNGIGGEVEMTYRPSTQYRLDDRQRGKPWGTHLPFPVNCVKSMVIKDFVAETTCTKSYAYHNGCYDPGERQFRGFQMVDEWVEEDFAAVFDEDGRATVPEKEGCAPGPPKLFRRPPVLTKSWFYVGLQQIDETSVLPGSWQNNQPQPSPLPSSTVRDMESLTVEELQDAYRALAGQTRRQEIFSVDGTPKCDVPYLISEQTYGVVMYQGAHRDQWRGVFRVNAREEITSIYERTRAEEPAVQHSVVLKSDEYGNVCSQAVMHYGNPSSRLQGGDKEKQEETIIVHTETVYTNALDPLYPQDATVPDSGYFQTPLPAEIRQYRVYPGSSWEDNGQNRYSWESLERLAASLAKADNIPIQGDSTAFNSPANGSKALIFEMCTLYSTPDLESPLPPRELKPFSIEYQSYQLVFSKELLEGTLKNGDLPLVTWEELANELNNGGYKTLEGRTDEWWAPSTRNLFKDRIGSNAPRRSREISRSHFYIPNAAVDQYGNMTSWEIDEYMLLPLKTVDAVNNETAFTNDYVHLQPTLVTDVNGNRTQTSFDPFGRAIGVAYMGKEREEVGDSLDGLESTLTETQLQSFIQDPSGPVAQELLGKAARRTIYKDACEPGRKPTVPTFRAELERDKHYRDPSPSQISVRITYLNGNGQPIQNTSLSGNSETERKWQFSNCVVSNSKGQPVSELFPFTTSFHDFRTWSQNADIPGTTFLRDAFDRPVAQLNADHTWSKTRFSPWSQVVFDAGDTIGIDDPEKDEDVGWCFTLIDRDQYYPTWYGQKKSGRPDEDQAIRQSIVYRDTPKSVHMDPSGREIVTIVDNGPRHIDPGLPNLPPESHQDVRESRTEYDVRGNASVLRDALDRVVTKTWYDLLGRPVHSVNLDSGHCWLLSDCSGAPLLSWLGGNPRKRICYDALRRKKRIMLLSDTASEKCMVEYVYGEETDKLGGMDALENNLRRRLYQCWDQSGQHTNNRFDFKGNCVESSVRYANEYREHIDWSSPVELEKITFKTIMSFDALGRSVQSTAVDGNDTTSTIMRAYDLSGRLKSIRSSSFDNCEASVSNIEYSDDDRITQIEYKSGTFTENDYDPYTRRLVKTCTERITNPRCIQNISYIYDCAGRTVQKTDKAQQGVFFANSVVSPSQKFSYDALGQLTKATGREQVDGGQKQLPAYDACTKRNKGRGNGNEMIQYEETYQYDVAGNIQNIRHKPHANGYHGWTRTYTYTEQSCTDTRPNVYSNRLSKSTSTGRTESYRYDDNQHRDNPGTEYDGNGSITSMPGYSLKWDHNNKLRSLSRQKATNGTTPETTWYIYNAKGERVRKVTDSSASPNGAPTPAKMKDTRYLPLRDIYRKYVGPTPHEVMTVSVGDPSVARTPLVMVEIIKVDTKPDQHLLRYQISNHLELDSDSNVISYEEFSPFGTSTYQTRNTAAPRKYRFASYRRDSESGLYLCGERYYAPWLGRWTSADPGGTFDGPNLYSYVGNDPVNYEDHRGMNREGRRRPIFGAGVEVPMEVDEMEVPMEVDEGTPQPTASDDPEPMEVGIPENRGLLDCFWRTVGRLQNKGPYQMAAESGVHDEYLEAVVSNTILEVVDRNQGSISKELRRDQFSGAGRKLAKEFHTKKVGIAYVADVVPKVDGHCVLFTQIRSRPDPKNRLQSKYLAAHKGKEPQWRFVDEQPPNFGRRFERMDANAWPAMGANARGHVFAIPPVMGDRSAVYGRPPLSSDLFEFTRGIRMERAARIRQANRDVVLARRRGHHDY
ncbi:virulence plasmid 65kDa B protein-domain-containing protein [Aspergillus cavernicola]|uniref:Virulence plasmid 65kDa B protein-domain-containing protein n=1 Tax=Aspergillus cavernicola TaxID=176166 RepID=A0ABR4I6S1_9EURO